MNHNSIIFRRLAIFSIIAIGCCIAGCHRHGGHGGTDESLEWCTVAYEDSVVLDEGTVYQEINVDFPTISDIKYADKGSVAALEWIQKKVADCCFPNFEGEKIDTVIDFDIDHTGQFAELFVQSYGKQGLQRMSNMLKEFHSEIDAADFEVTYSNMLQIEMLEESENYITLASEYDVYMGGAHGSQYLIGVSFDKETGTQLGWNLLDLSKKQELIELIKAGLKDYFSSSDNQVTTDEQLMDFLQLFDDPETSENELEFGLPLPSSEPYLTGDGLNFVYQEYEIAAYCFGRPCVTIPLEQLSGLLSDYGKKFLK